MFLRLLLIAGICLFTGTASAQNTVTQYSAGPDAVDPDLAGYELILDARLTKDGQTVENGLIWRVFGSKPLADGKYPLIATAKGGTASFTLNSGTYLVHAAYGRAGASKKVILDGKGALESLILNAGGLELNAEAENTAIPESDLRFTIFEMDKGEEIERKVIAKDIPANKIIALNAGTYHILSHFGFINAEVRADLVVKKGEVTKAVLQHRAAEISLRLVSHPGGDPVANTAWSVFTEDGEKVFDSNSIAPSLILAEGAYEASARNGNQNYKKIFSIKPGKNARVEILVR